MVTDGDMVTEFDSSYHFAVAKLSLVISLMFRVICPKIVNLH